MIDGYLPRSIGIEIECDQGPTFDKEFFTNIPYIMDVGIDSYEQRYRIPNGLRGLVCLYLISLTCKQHSLLNVSSGIHYHIDLTDCFFDFKHALENSKESQTFLLSQLDEWDYKGTYNTRCLGSGGVWARFQEGFKTLEIRIGEMTFDYEVLIKRIRSITRIVEILMDTHGIIRNPKYQPISSALIEDFLGKSVHIYDSSIKQTIKTLEEERTKLIKQSADRQRVLDVPVSKSRIVKLY